MKDWRAGEWMGLTQLRTMNATRLREMTMPAIVIGLKDEPPLAALVPYELFMEWQVILRAALQKAKGD